MSELPRISSVCATILTAFGLTAPDELERANKAATDLLDGKKADRVVIYNPDAIAYWLYEKYPDYFSGAEKTSDIAMRITSVMPSVTPVCFASMYSGLMPEKHGIQKYEKPVLKVDTLFDYLPAQGIKCAIVSTAGDSISKIFLERNIDYFIYPSIRKVNRKAASLIKDSDYDLIVIYNPDYDSNMHRCGPEGKKAIKALKADLAAYVKFVSLIKAHHGDKKVLYGFCPDHGCHEIDGGRGSHGLDMDEDMNVIHFYGVTE